MRKHFVAAALAAIGALSLLAGCGGSSVQAPTPITTTTFFDPPPPGIAGIAVQPASGGTAHFGADTAAADVQYRSFGLTEPTIEFYVFAGERWIFVGKAPADPLSGSVTLRFGLSEAERVAQTTLVRARMVSLGREIVARDEGHVINWAP